MTTQEYRAHLMQRLVAVQHKHGDHQDIVTISAFMDTDELAHHVMRY